MTDWKNLLGKTFGVKVPEEPSPKKTSSRGKNFSSSRRNSSPQVFSSRKATAPYNFVSLPEKVLPAQFEDFRDHVKKYGHLSGEISLELEALTPFFIGGNFNATSKSFSPVDEPIIPGGSLRGMFKNLFKIVTCGAFRGQTDSQKQGEDFNDEHIYFRCLMKNKQVARDDGYNWSVDLNKLYDDRTGRNKKNPDVKKVQPGFLIRVDGKYFIAPSLVPDNKKDRILIREYEKTFGEEIPERNSSCVKWHGNTAYIITGSQPCEKLHEKKSYERLNGDEKKKAGKQFIRYTKIDYVDWCRDHWKKLPEDVRISYEDDRNRRGVNLFDDEGILKRGDKLLAGKGDIETLIPCHYLTDEKGTVTAFGHGQCFRIPYKNPIGAAVPKELLGKNVIDFADAVFGKEKLWASRVYFEDARPKNFETLETAEAHPLMQPNPTSYQLYLVQDDKNGKLKHWDIHGVQLRGYKLYWHKTAKKTLSDWQANSFELNEDNKRLKKGQEPLIKKMTPLNVGSKFTAKIRFKNLSKEELGALMMIFDLDGFKTAAYKIGQGKPFGFGSIKITPKLFVEDETAYTELFDGDGWKNPLREENPAEYLKAFKKYLRDRKVFDTWQDVMKELKTILDWSHTEKSDWDSKVDQMSGEVKNKDDGTEEFELNKRFKIRESLPSIFEVVK